MPSNDTSTRSTKHTSLSMSIDISATLTGLSITEAYESDEDLTHLLRRANIAANERARINSEGFNNLKSLIDNFATTKASI